MCPPLSVCNPALCQHPLYLSFFPSPHSLSLCGRGGGAVQREGKTSGYTVEPLIKDTLSTVKRTLSVAPASMFDSAMPLKEGNFLHLNVPVFQRFHCS